jgi:hypothetical protein
VTPAEQVPQSLASLGVPTFGTKEADVADPMEIEVAPAAEYAASGRKAHLPNLQRVRPEHTEQSRPQSGPLPEPDITSYTESAQLRESVASSDDGQRGKAARPW